MAARGGQGLTLRGPESLRGVPARQGQGSFLFLRKKKRALTPRQNEFHSAPSPWGDIRSIPFVLPLPTKAALLRGPPWGPVYGGFLVVHGGLRLSALFGDQPRPLRPSHCRTEKSCGSICGPPGGATLAAECGGAPGASRPIKSPAPPQGRHLTAPALREAPAGGGWIERKPVPVPQGQAVTAGRGPSCHTKAAGRRFLSTNAP